MAGREQKQSRRPSLSLSLLSPKKKAVTPSKSLYISKPINSYGPSGESLGIHSDDIVPLRVYTDIFGPSLHYKSVGVNRSTTATAVIENIIQKMSRTGDEDRSYSYTEFCLVEICILSEFSYFRLLGESTPPLHFYQQHSKRYANTDSWRLKLILKSQLKSSADLVLYCSKRDPSLIGVVVECNCLEDTFLSVYFHLPGYTTCEKIINKIISEFAYARQPDDFTLFCPAIHTTARDPLPNGLTLEFILKQSKTQILELALRFRYDDYGEDCDLTDTEEPFNAPETSKEEQIPKHSEQVDDTESTWVEYYDSARDKIYYVNSKTEEVIRVHPATQQEMYLDSDMPPGWVRGVDKETGRVYYRNTFDKKIEWSHPLRHLERIYKRSLQQIATTSLPRPSVTPPLHKPPSRTPPPIPRSARPSLPPSELRQIKTELQSHSLHSSNQSFSDIERASSDALLSEFLSVSNKDKIHIRKNKRLSHLRRLLVNEKFPQDSDNLSLGSGHRIKSFFQTTKKLNASTPLLDVIVRVTPNPSPAGRKKPVISESSYVSEKSLPTSKLSSLPRSFGGESYGREDRSNETDGPFMRSVSEQEPAQSAVTALDEAFSLLDNMKDVEEIYENKNARLEEKGRETENSLNDCFQIIDSSFDEGSDQEMIDYPVVVVDTDRLVDSVDYSEQSEVFSLVRDDDATFDTEFMKVSSYEHNGGNNLKATNMSALVGEGNESLDTISQRPASVCSFSSGDLGSQKSEDGSTSGRSKLRTRKGRMSRNTSALNHQELEQLNKGIEPVQKSILKHSKSDIEVDNNNNNYRKVKGVTFLSSAVQMIEIERRRDSESSDTPSLDTQSVIHRRGAGNWRNMLKTFYDEVDSERGDSNLMWSPDEGIGLVEEEKFIHEANKLTRDQQIPHIVTEHNEEKLIHSLKHSLTSHTHPDMLSDTHVPLLPPRPAPDDLAASATSSPSPSLPDSEGSLPPSTPKHTDTNDTTHDKSTQQIYKSFSDSFKDSVSTTDTSGVTDSGMFSLDLSPRTEDLSQSLTQLVFDSLSGTLADTTSGSEAFPRSEQTGTREEPVIVSSLVVPITPNNMVPMDMFLPKERPSLLREQLVPRSLTKEEIPSPMELVPSLIPPSPTDSSKHLQTLSNSRPISPVLVDQLNKPLSGTPFIYGYQYQRKPADKSTTLHSGYLALVNQQSELESKQKMKQIN